MRMCIYIYHNEIFICMHYRNKLPLISKGEVYFFHLNSWKNKVSPDAGNDSVFHENKTPENTIHILYPEHNVIKIKSFRIGG